MNLKWLKHIPDRKEKGEFKKHLLANKELFTVLRNILQTDLDNTISSRRSVKSFVTQAWSEYQADCNATERTLQEIINLLPLENLDD